MCRNQELAVRSDPWQSRKEPVLLWRMQVQFEFIDQHDRALDVETNKLINQREDGLFS